MRVIPTDIPDIKLIEPRVFGDERGYFYEVWNQEVFDEQGIASDGFVQDNHSLSTQYTLRGLHYQVQQAQGKLVRCTAGEVFDVAVDLRASSPTFGRWVGHRLSATNKLQMWIPPGFAHGFYVLSETAEFQYKCTEFYAPEHERTLAWDDSELAIRWPVEHRELLIVSGKDQAGDSLKNCEKYA